MRLCHVDFNTVLKNQLNQKLKLLTEVLEYDIGARFVIEPNFYMGIETNPWLKKIDLSKSDNLCRV